MSKRISPCNNCKEIDWSCYMCCDKLGKDNKELQMPRIKSKMVGDKITVQSIEGVLERNDLPKAYLEHVPYMYYIPDYEDIMINVVGHIYYIHIGSTYKADDWDDMMDAARKCYDRLHNIKSIPDKNNLESIAYVIEKCQTGIVSYEQCKEMIKELLDE